MRGLPLINSRYWLTLVAASIFGTNTGDMIAIYFHLGNLAGLPWLAAVLALVFLVERFSPVASAVYFWAAIIVIRTGATNIADATHPLGIYGVALVPVILLAFAGMVWVYQRRVEASPDAARSDAVSPVAAGTAKVDAVYWLCMALAGIAGTLLGDYGAGAFAVASWGVAHLAGFAPGGFEFSWMQSGHLTGMIVFGAAVIATLAGNSLADLAKPVKYWTLLALIRTAGTAAGDYLAHTGLGLAGSSILTGLVFATLVVGFYAVRNDNLVAIGQPG